MRKYTNGRRGCEAYIVGVPHGTGLVTFPVGDRLGSTMRVMAPVAPFTLAVQHRRTACRRKARQGEEQMAGKS